MKRHSAFCMCLVLLLSACQIQPIAAPPQAEAQGQQQQSLTSAFAPPALMDQELGQKLQAALEAALASPDSAWPGAILHVRAPGLGAWSGAAGLGDVETDTPMRPHDRFRAGSLTKPFVATVILQLVEEGRFGLDDPISALLPEEAAGKVTNSDQITVRMLLNHTSGAPDFMRLAGPEIIANPSKVWTAEEFLDFAAAQEPTFAPGAGQRYSNTGYLLLGMIIEQATGRPWRQEVRERIFEPLQLENTFLPEPEEMVIQGDHAHGYANFGQGPFDASDLVTASVVGAAGGQSLVTNAADLATFLEALLAGKFFKKSESLNEMLTMVPFGADQDLAVAVKEYGLGLNKALFGNGVWAIGHSGDTDGGYDSFVYRFPEQGITISGAVNIKDPAAGYGQLMPRVLEVLVPGFTMAAAAPQQPDPGAALQGLLDDQVQKQGILGMIMAARLPDGTIIDRSSGTVDREGKVAWTMNTQSELGSITKTFSAVVIMQLIEEGKLSLDDTIDRWFPDQPNGDKITVRMLLSHTSGLANFIQPENERDPKWSQDWTPQELVAIANEVGPVDEPGSTVAHYANTNFTLLGMIVEAITGSSWENEVRSRIIAPLGLKDTAFVTDEGVWGGTLIPGYAKMADGYASTLEIPNLPSAGTGWAVGSVVSTLADLMTFASALFDGKLVSEESLAAMATGIAPDPDGVRVWGLGGATLKGVPGSFGMGGENPGYRSIFVGQIGTPYIVAGMANTEEADVVSPALQAFQYLASQLQAGQ